MAGRARLSGIKVALREVSRSGRQLRRTILLAEDDARMRALGQRILEAAGYVVLIADNGLDAVKMAEAFDLDLVLMDVGLPGIDGMEAVHRIKRKQAAVPVIILSDADVLDGPQTANLAGANGFVQKPYNSRDLLARVASHLP
jgi:DNA-binding response OmpR family regulator